ncbi:unnamed protein product [Miscanthus lutarioriparius]|uniref:RING-type domain-containing protein n=1 Tax=Miscanthus lutarioriparius TaxID=422564 RepID=A0A811RS10_9POAL|nr:unnamed protein product [Miscanthus lutarioriparius]
MSLARYDANLLLAAVTALSAAVAFVAALHLYARCLLQRRVALAEGQGSPHVVVLQRQRPPDGYVVEVVEGAGVGGQQAAGLDAKALCALPVFTWESSEQEKEEEEEEEGGVAAELHGQQCAVCLGEMEDGELGRLLPACRHVFHVECIDTWLGVSSTCRQQHRHRRFCFNRHQARPCLDGLGGGGVPRAAVAASWPCCQGKVQQENNVARIVQSNGPNQSSAR